MGKLPPLIMSRVEFSKKTYTFLIHPVVHVGVGPIFLKVFIGCISRPPSVSQYTHTSQAPYQYSERCVLQGPLQDMLPVGKSPQSAV